MSVKLEMAPHGARVIRQTHSVCPVCLARLEAQVVEKEGLVYLCKTCAQHGDFQTLIWNGPGYEDWARPRPAAVLTHSHTVPDRGCPFDCGICPEHRQNTCCVLLEVTYRCNLSCPVCFASSGEGEDPDPSLEEIARWYDLLMESGGPYNIQLSGGEPTLRDDLAEIITLGRKKGFSFFQLNTNGLRLAQDSAYLQSLVEAGLSCVFLQFDGLNDRVYEALRGARLMEQKLRALDNCARCGVGVVLVPTLVPGVNDDQLGQVLDFAVERLPYIRGVHFQPVSYFGRYPETGRRLTIPDVLNLIQEQTGGRMRREDFSPGTAENAYCSFNAAWLLEPDGELKKLGGQTSCCSCSCETQAQEPGDSDKARQYVANRWGAEISKEVVPKDQSPQSLDEFISRTRQYTLAVSGMLFQDAWNLDLDRLKDCYIHVVSPQGRVIPFCAYNLTAADGQSLYRP